MPDRIEALKSRDITKNWKDAEKIEVEVRLSVTDYIKKQEELHPQLQTRYQEFVDSGPTAREIRAYVWQAGYITDPDDDDDWKYLADLPVNSDALRNAHIAMFISFVKKHHGENQPFCEHGKTWEEKCPFCELIENGVSEATIDGLHANARDVKPIFGGNTKEAQIILSKSGHGKWAGTNPAVSYYGSGSEVTRISDAADRDALIGGHRGANLQGLGPDSFDKAHEDLSSGSQMNSRPDPDYAGQKAIDSRTHVDKKAQLDADKIPVDTHDGKQPLESQIELPSEEEDGGEDSNDE